MVREVIRAGCSPRCVWDDPRVGFLEQHSCELPGERKLEGVYEVVEPIAEHLLARLLRGEDHVGPGAGEEERI